MQNTQSGGINIDAAGNVMAGNDIVGRDKIVIQLGSDSTVRLPLQRPRRVERFIILPEERYLAAKFGKEYVIYTASVHRWLGRAHDSK